MNNVLNTDMPKYKLTVTIDKKVLHRLKSLAKKQNRSLSNMIETLVIQEYER